MNRYRVGAVVVLLLLSRMASADDIPVGIDNSRSPDGKVELWIQPVDSLGEAVGTVQIREVRNDRILATLDWSGFGEHADNRAFTVLWRGDSQYFAISYELTRGWMSGSIYGRTIHGHWREVKLPSDEYVSRVKKMSGVDQLSSGKGCETPKRWLPDGDLELEFCSRNITFDDVDAMREFEIELRVTDERGRPAKLARIVDIRQKSEEKVEKELQSE